MQHLPVRHIALPDAVTGPHAPGCHPAIHHVFRSQTCLQLDYGSIKAQAPHGMPFVYAAAGMTYVSASSDCKQGLLNANCQIAHGSA